MISHTMLAGLFRKKPPPQATGPEDRRVTRQGFISHHKPGTKIKSNLQRLCDRSFEIGVTNLLLQNENYALHIAEGPQLAVQEIIGSTLPHSEGHRHGFLFSSHADQTPFLRRPLVWIAHAQTVEIDLREELDTMLDRYNYGRNDNRVLTPTELGFLVSLEMYSWIPPKKL